MRKGAWDEAVGRMTYTYDGYVCVSCGAWTPYGHAHHCLTATTNTATPRNSEPSLQDVMRELRAIRELLERKH